METHFQHRFRNLNHDVNLIGLAGSSYKNHTQQLHLSLSCSSETSQALCSGKELWLVLFLGWLLGSQCRKCLEESGICVEYSTSSSPKWEGMQQGESNCTLVKVSKTR